MMEIKIIPMPQGIAVQIDEVTFAGTKEWAHIIYDTPHSMDALIEGLIKARRDRWGTRPSLILPPR